MSHTSSPTSSPTRPKRIAPVLARANPAFFNQQHLQQGGTPNGAPADAFGRERESAEATPTKRNEGVRIPSRTSSASSSPTNLSVPLSSSLGRSAGASSIPKSPSALAESISALHLDDDEDDEDGAGGMLGLLPGAQLDARGTANLMSETGALIQEIRRDIFTTEERRHAGAFHSSSSASSSPITHAAGGQHSALDAALVGLEEKMERGRESMAKLDAAMRVLTAQPTGVEGEMEQWSKRQRRDSVGSSSSLTSFDLALQGSSGGLLSAGGEAPSPAALQATWAELSESWAGVQAEAETLKTELAEDKYVVVFQSVSSQAAGMMDSLDKALAVCTDFLTAASSAASSASPSRWGSGAEGAAAQLADLAARRHTFDVKRGHYGPACEQVFSVLERGLRDRATSNGSILRRFSELKSRWKALREAMSRMDKELRRIELALKAVRSEAASSPAAAPQASSSSSSLGVATPTRARLGPKSSARDLRGQQRGSPATNSTSSPSAQRSPSAGNLFSLATQQQPTPPPKPPRSARRQSISDLSSTFSPARSTGSAYAPGIYRPGAPASSSGSPHVRSASTSYAQHLSPHRPGTAGQLTDRPAWNASTHVKGDSTDPVERYGHATAASISGRTTPGGSTHHMSPARKGVMLLGRPHEPPSSYRPPSGVYAPPPRSKTPQPQSSWARAGSEPPPSSSVSAYGGGGAAPKLRHRSTTSRGAASVAGDEAMEDLLSGDTSLESFAPRQGRPASVAGMYYRPPPSDAGASDRASKRNSMIPRLAFPHGGSDAGSDAGAAGTGRPGSALSQASASTYAGVTARNHASNGATYQPSSRSTMQTPEPTIAARVQRLSMFARPQTKASGGASGTPNARKSSRPPPARYNAAGGAGKSNGRTTPLSAAALAALPNEAGAGKMGQMASSVANFRASRGAGGSVAGSGRATPTFSEGGASSTWGGGLGRGQTGALEMYRPNGADALDVEVAHIVNALGVGLERISEPLPRGVRAEPRPGQEIQAQYSIGGGKAVMCKLLELHRPAGSAGARSGTKVRKVLAKVGGGWIDLEQHVLTLLGAT